MLTSCQRTSIYLMGPSYWMKYMIIAGNTRRRLKTPEALISCYWESGEAATSDSMSPDQDETPKPASSHWILLPGREEAKQFRGFMNVPRSAITIGIATILNAKKIILSAFGETKAKVIKQMVEDEPSNQVPASYIQLHSNAKVMIDTGAALQLVRMKTPWLLDSMDWSEDRLIRKAVLWLCGKTQKPLLKLTGKDYNDFGLSDLLATVGSAYKINIKVFNDLQHTITGWPGGKPNVDDAFRPGKGTA